MRRSVAVTAGVPTIMAVMTMVACATGGGSSAADALWREEIGRSTHGTLQAAVDKVFRKHTVELRRTQADPGDRELRYESVWVSRQVTATEEGVGTTGARNRIVLIATVMEAGRGGDVFSGDGVYRVRWQVENEVTSVDNTNWHPGRMPTTVRARFRAVLSDLELELRTGIR